MEYYYKKEVKNEATDLENKIAGMESGIVHLKEKLENLKTYYNPEEIVGKCYSGRVDHVYANSYIKVLSYEHEEFGEYYKCASLEIGKTHVAFSESRRIMPGVLLSRYPKECSDEEYKSAYEEALLIISRML